MKARPYRIESGVPIPMVRKYQIPEMKIGECLITKNYRMADSIRVAGGRRGWKMVMRQCGDETRVWRKE